MTTSTEKGSMNNSKHIDLQDWFILYIKLYLSGHICELNQLSWYFDMSSGDKSLKYGCFKASFIEIRRVGSNANIFMHKSRPTLTKFLKWFSGLIPLNLGKVGLKSGNFWILLHSDGVGVPWNWNILKIWSISESPLNSGRFSVSSAKIHPTAQISTPKLYCFWPSKTSGARYHSV